MDGWLASSALMHFHLIAKASPQATILGLALMALDFRLAFSSRNPIRRLRRRRSFLAPGSTDGHLISALSTHLLV